MTQVICNDMDGIPPFPENGGPVAVSIPPTKLNNYPHVIPEEKQVQDVTL